ncbi:MAG: UDP-N-acetylglucosamine--N-acetylmuramyl-(pentapeptide) pyrophosphoryl-undecaprenol [Chthoniobacter sp.]|jgi:UDP-N-acetylglucosamine--N-acetylmuramyl-(pentapeptide) pyrophosphoryl-undecaprenol N-acetylglucosamine transferase|nr:UDP-N-acetylglucosamine--N-acetylmuramyl-(pentapeptide) pyrophosphoryl-undecaprenol [Chthoniobacter sp.]
MRVAIAGGGTGGHLFPALAVAEALVERGHEPLIFISEKEIDALATRDRTEFRFERLPGIGMPKLFSPAVFGFVKRFRDGVEAVRAIYKRFEPDAVLGMGGFTSTAPILAGRRRKVPTFLHESNAIPGKANKLNARMTSAVLLGFGDCAKFFPRSRCEVTGTPIRKSLTQRVSREEALSAFDLVPGRKTLLVMGGSQGAHGINEALVKALPSLADLPLQIIHLTGAEDEQLVMANYRRGGVSAHVAAFCHQMEKAYAAADLAISRSGAASLAELSHFGLPSVLIPFPHAAENHQALNAEIFERGGAAETIEQSRITPEALGQRLRELLGNPGRLEAMAGCARKLAPENAAARVVEVMEKEVAVKKGGKT